MTVSTSSRASSRILIIEDHALFAEALEFVLTMEGYAVRRLLLEGVGSSVAALTAAALRSKPRVALLDLGLGTWGNGESLIAPLASAGVGVVVVTGCSDLGRWGSCVRQGAHKILAKTTPLAETVSVVRRLERGFRVMSPEEREDLLEHWHANREATDHLRDRIERLSPRERAVLGELRDGHNVREIAERSVVSEATVRTQVKAILSKLEVSSQLAAVGLANRWDESVG